MSDNKRNLGAAKKIGFTAATLIVIFNLVFWLYLYWFDQEFMRDEIYGKIIATSIVLAILALVVAGFASYMDEEEKLKKDKLIN